MAIPRRLVVGTAGHIDHGKSLLVQALTGTHPDRLKEEQERGITIDLGFASLTLPDGTLVWKTDRRRWTDLSAMSARIEALRTQVGAIRCPVLILRGAESDVFLDEDAERFAAALPDARWRRIEAAGHTVQGDQPAALVREVRAFLANAPRAFLAERQRV